MKKHNFNAGPSILPNYTIENTANAVKDLDGIGLSVLEISHRSKEFQAIMDEAVILTKEILSVPSGYSVLFLGGGASLQFCMIPYNLMNQKAAYLNTGAWAGKALKEAKFFGDAIEVASSKDKNFSYIPKNYDIPSDVDYFHITTNNTIFGTQIHKDLDVDTTLVADMSSDIFSRPIDVSKYGIIYAGAQKNLGPAGVAIVIIKDELLGKVDRQIPSYLNYQTHIDNGSMFNTPPCGSIFSGLQTLKWIKNLGGIEKIEQMNIEKSQLLYDEIERNNLFASPTAAEDRSKMNTCFIMKDEYKDLESSFLDFAVSKGMIGIKGHRSVGGFRASTYNALPKESILALIDTMKEFENNH